MTDDTDAEIIEEMLAAGMMEALFPSDGIFWKNPDGTLTKIEPEDDDPSLHYWATYPVEEES